MTYKKRFCWKFITTDGLVKDIPCKGPDWNPYSFNEYFETEELAIEALAKWEKLYKYAIYSEFTLITVYVREDWV